jgi:uncharacterized protein HemY
METLELIINALKWVGIFFTVIIIIYIILGIIIWLCFLPEKIRDWRQEKRYAKERELRETIIKEIHYQMKVQYSIEKNPKRYD